LNKYHSIWSKETHSGNRSDDEEFLSRKTFETLHTLEEYASYCNNSVADIGCGAGELLIKLIDKINICLALDFSPSMLEKCKQRLTSLDINKKPKLILGGLDKLEELNQEYWISTGALSQFCDEKGISKLLNHFEKNQHVNYLILFDTIDPIRYNLVQLGLSYNKSFFNLRIFNPILNIFIFFLKYPLISLKRFLFISTNFLILFFSKSKCIRLQPLIMGLAYLPSFWSDITNKNRLFLKIISSREFEYRYHVILAKNPI